jgi:hypothetical protein
LIHMILNFEGFSLGSLWAHSIICSFRRVLSMIIQT